MASGPEFWLRPSRPPLLGLPLPWRLYGWALATLAATTLSLRWIERLPFLLQYAALLLMVAGPALSWAPDHATVHESRGISC
jgi:hypothetical protein